MSSKEKDKFYVPNLPEYDEVKFDVEKSLEARRNRLKKA